MIGQAAACIHRTILASTGPERWLRPETVDHIADCSLRLIEGQGETPGAASAIAYEAVGALYDDVFGSQSAMLLADEESGVRRAHFSRMFADSEGLPPAAFVLQERMRRAARLLTSHSLLPIKEIANLCGFDEPNYFAKVFRRFFGTSPTEFRTTGMYAATGGERLS